MRYECEFAERLDGPRQNIIVELTSDEVAAVERIDGLHAQAYALRHAYRQVPDSHRHASPPRLLLSH